MHYLLGLCVRKIWAKLILGAKKLKHMRKHKVQKTTRKTTHRNCRVISASPSRLTHNFIQIIFSSFTLLTAAANFKLKTSLTTAASKIKILRFVIFFFSFSSDLLVVVELRKKKGKSHVYRVLNTLCSFQSSRAQ